MGVLKTKCCFCCVLFRWLSVCLCKLKMVKRRGVKNTEQNVPNVKPSLSNSPKNASSNVSTKKEKPSSSNPPKTAPSNVSTKKEIDLNKDDKSTKGKISSNNADTNKKNESRKNSSASIRSKRSVSRGSIASIRSNRSSVRGSIASIRSKRSNRKTSIANKKYTTAENTNRKNSITRKSNSNKSILSRISSRFSRKKSTNTLSPDSKTKNLTQESKNNIKSTNSLNPTYNHSNGYFKEFLPFWYYDPSSYYHRYPYPSDCFQPYSFMTSHLAPTYIDCNPCSPCNPCMSLPSTTKICYPLNPCTAESVHKLATNLAAKIVAEHKQKKKLKKIIQKMSSESLSTSSKSTKYDIDSQHLKKSYKEKSSRESLESSSKNTSDKNWVKKLQKALKTNHNCDKSLFGNKKVVVIEDSDTDCSEFEYQLVKVKRKSKC